MADRTATDEAIDLLQRKLGRSIRHVGRYWLRQILDALPAGLLRRLADQKDGGPLFEGYVATWFERVAGNNELAVVGKILRTPEPNEAVVVYPAPETTT
jgi:hypothetical protein